jgi:hypothetical protein
VTGTAFHGDGSVARLLSVAKAPEVVVKPMRMFEALHFIVYREGPMTLHKQKKYLLAINIIGGSSVIFSYIHGIMTHPEAAPALWGNVPKALMPLYTANMFVAAAGYLLFTFFLLFRLDADEARVAGRYRYGVFNWLYAVILVPSALWMPFTFMMIAQPSPGTWIAVRLVLTLTGVGSLCMLTALLRVSPRTPVWAHVLAVIGCIGFCVQTAVLDALVWTAYFPPAL